MAEKIYNDKLITSKIEKTKSPENGVVTTTTFKGSKAALEEEFNKRASDATSLDNIRIGWGDAADPSMQVIAAANNLTNPDNNKVMDTYWEVDCNTIQEPVENNKYWLSANQTQLGAAIKWYRDNKAGDFTSTDTKAVSLYKDCLKKGKEYFLDYNIVLRKTDSCATGSNLKASMENIFHVQSLTTINPPSYILDSLSILDLEWLKQPPRIRQISKIRYAIIYEYWSCYKWAGAFYSGGTGTPTG